MLKDTRNWLIIAVLLFGAAFSVGLFKEAKSDAVREAFAVFSAQANDRLLAIENSITSEKEIVHSVVSFYNGSSFVDRDEFRTFSHDALSRNPSIQALEWVPRVPHDDRDGFVAEAKSNFHMDFAIKERGPTGALVPAKVRDEYFPIFYVEPLANNLAAIGFDLGSNPARRAALERARDTGSLIASERINLVQGGIASLFIVPVYEHELPSMTVLDRRNALKGFSIGVVAIGPMVEKSLASRSALRTPAGIDLLIFDLNAPPEKKLLHFHPSRIRRGTVLPDLTYDKAATGTHIAHRIEVGGRTWEVIAKPVDPALGLGMVWSAWMIALLAMAMSILFALLLRTQFNRAREVEFLVSKRTQDLRQSESRVRAIVDTAHDGIVTFDANGVIETANPAIGRLFDVQIDLLPGSQIETLIPDLAILNGNFTDIGSAREFQGRRRNGSSFPLELSIAEMNLGTAPMFTAIAHDITERKIAEKAKREFISTISHELRTPLTSIKGSLGLIQSGALGALPDKLQSMLGIAYKSCTRLVLLINDILDIERIEAGRMRYRLEELDVSTLVRNAIDANKGFGEEFGVKLDLVSAHRPFAIKGDRDRLIQVLTNLISNAVKFSPKGETVSIAVTDADGNVRISVSDRGPGIPESFKDAIFGKFRQADSSDTRQKGGTGLGLNISKAIVEHHGGIIGFESIAGQGATFFVELPEMAALVEEATPLRHANGKRKLLICEDEPDIAMLLTLMLDEAGYETAVAHSAAQAKEMLSGGGFDGMTLDICLPDQDGIGLLRELRDRDDTHDLPILVVSAKPKQDTYTLNGDIIDIIDWLEKPIDQALLTRRLNEALVTAKTQKPRILHVEDDRDLSSVVAAMVAERADLVSAYTLKEAKDCLARDRFDLVVLDLTLPDGSGEELLPKLYRPDRTPIPVIIFSAREASGTSLGTVCATLLKSQVSNEELMRTINLAIG